MPFHGHFVVKLSILVRTVLPFSCEILVYFLPHAHAGLHAFRVMSSEFVLGILIIYKDS